MLDLINKRCCQRTFTNKKILKENVMKILEAARLAPSWMNVQPWKFLVVEENETKKILRELCFGQAQVEEASHVILCCEDLSAWNDDNFGKILAQRGLTQEQIAGILKSQRFNPKNISLEMLIARSLEQCTYAIAYMTLEAESLGISSGIIGAVAGEINNQNPQLLAKVKEKLNIGKDLIIGTILVLGYAPEENKNTVKTRKDMQEIVSFEKF